MESKSFHVEKVQKIVESKETEKLLGCIRSLELRATPIGEGGNAVVYVAEGTPYEKVCLKKVRENPVILGNSIDKEHEFQMAARKAGVRTPLSLLSLDTNEGRVLIMERIIGHTLQEILIKPALLPENFNYNDFCKAFDAEMEKLHNAEICHRDLHSRNVMIDEEGNPVIIDFGTATYGNTESDLAYQETVSMYNPSKDRYELQTGYFKDDTKMAKNLKASLRSALHQNSLTKSFS